MGPIKVFRQGKGTFCEWHYKNGQSLGRILNQGEGMFLDNAFATLEDAVDFCKNELNKDAPSIFYVLRGEGIIEVIQNDAYHLAKDKHLNRNYAVVSLAVVMLLAASVSFIIMPFKTVIQHLLFISGMGSFYLLVYTIAGKWNLESVVAAIVLLVLLSVAVPVFLSE